MNFNLFVCFNDVLTNIIKQQQNQAENKHYAYTH